MKSYFKKTSGLSGADPESIIPIAFVIRESNSLLGSYARNLFLKSSLRGIIIYVTISRVFSPPSTSLCGGIVPSDLFIRTVRSGHVPYCVRRCQYINRARRATIHEKLIFASCFSRSHFSNQSRNLLKRPAKVVFLGTRGHFNTRVRDLSWRATFAYLAQASSTPSS